MTSRILLKQGLLASLLLSLGCGGGASGFGGQNKKQADQAPTNGASSDQGGQSGQGGQGAELGAASRSDEGDKASQPQQVSGAFLTCVADPSIDLPAASSGNSVVVGCAAMDAKTNQKIDLTGGTMKVDELNGTSTLDVPTQQVMPASSPYHVAAVLPSLAGTVRLTASGSKHDGTYTMDAKDIKNASATLSLSTGYAFELGYKLFGTHQDVLHDWVSDQLSDDALCGTSGAPNPKVGGRLGTTIGQLGGGLIDIDMTLTHTVSFGYKDSDKCFMPFEIIDHVTGKVIGTSSVAQTASDCNYVKVKTKSTGAVAIAVFPVPTLMPTSNPQLQVLKDFATANTCN